MSNNNNNNNNTNNIHIYVYMLLMSTQEGVRVVVVLGYSRVPHYIFP